MYKNLKSLFTNKDWQNATVFLVCLLIALSIPLRGIIGLIIYGYMFIGFCYNANRFFKFSAKRKGHFKE